MSLAFTFICTVGTATEYLQQKSFDGLFHEVVITLGDVDGVLSGLNPSSSMDPDLISIHPALLKHRSQSLAYPLHEI